MKQINNIKVDNYIEPLAFLFLIKKEKCSYIKEL